MSKIAIYPSLEDKVVLITGGASGIGESIVRKFMQQGSKVAFIDKEQRLGNDLVKKFGTTIGILLSILLKVNGCK